MRQENLIKILGGAMLIFACLMAISSRGFEINYTAPENFSGTNDTTPTISLEYIHTAATSHCTLFFNGSNVSYNASCQTNTTTNLTPSTPLAYGVWKWHVQLDSGASTLDTGLNTLYVTNVESFNGTATIASSMHDLFAIEIGGAEWVGIIILIIFLLFGAVIKGVDIAIFGTLIIGGIILVAGQAGMLGSANWVAGFALIAFAFIIMLAFTALFRRN